MDGRIFFPKNAWPKGHRLNVLDWTGRLDLDRGLFFDLHLETERYVAESDDFEDSDEPSWSNPNVWSNYHSCTISSTRWEGYEGLHIGDEEDPFDFSTLHEWDWHLDQHSNTADRSLHSMHIYLLGHDACLRHRLHFSEPKGLTFRLDWKAKIALTYMGDRPLSHSLRVEADDVRFQGFRIPKKSRPQDVRDALARFTTGPTKYTRKKGMLIPTV